jgi:Mn2+/Fe2+ NRAMP family transporter
MDAGETRLLPLKLSKGRLILSATLLGAIFGGCYEFLYSLLVELDPHQRILGRVGMRDWSVLTATVAVGTAAGFMIGCHAAKRESSDQSERAPQPAFSRMRRILLKFGVIIAGWALLIAGYLWLTGAPYDETLERQFSGREIALNQIVARRIKSTT